MLVLPSVVVSGAPLAPPINHGSRWLLTSSILKDVRVTLRRTSVSKVSSTVSAIIVAPSALLPLVTGSAYPFPGVLIQWHKVTGTASLSNLPLLSSPPTDLQTVSLGHF